MLIICPNCRTRYSLQPAQLGQGRNVSCSNCQHVWFADPKDAQPDPPPQPARRPQQAYPPQGYPPQGYPQQGYPPQGYPPQGYAPQGYPPPAQGFAPPSPEPAAPPPAPKPAPEPKLMPEPEMDDDDDDDVSALPTDIDSMFEDEDEDIVPFVSLISDDDESDNLSDIGSPDQMEDPDEIPDVFRPDEQEPDDAAPRKSPILKIILFIFILLMGGIIGGVFFFKDYVVKAVPQLEKVFDMIGFTQVGAGLQIQKIESAQEVDAGLEVLVVRGRIENVSDKVRPVPMLRATLIGAEGGDVQHADVAPIKSQLKASEVVSFKIRIKEPSPLRRQVKVEFVDPKKASAH